MSRFIITIKQSLLERGIVMENYVTHNTSPKIITSNKLLIMSVKTWWNVPLRMSVSTGSMFVPATVAA